MICEYCGAETSASRPSYTTLGCVAILCAACFDKYGVRRRQDARLPAKAKAKTKKGRKSKDLPGQTYFPFYQPETVDSADVPVP